ncbi:MAG: homoprotocatechuate degradation operon regulator HpaR [Paracoccaceae bacterium]
MTETKQDRGALAETRRTLPIALLRARESVMERFRPMLSAHDITEQQWRVLRVLQEAGEADATQLARGACILGPSLTRILKALEARGLVEVRRDPGDGRRSIIRLTGEGTGFIAAITPESQAIYAGIEAKLGARRLDDLLDGLDDLLRLLGDP